jgi:glycosyltransferase involved in cell wall biosynthesis
MLNGSEEEVHRVSSPKLVRILGRLTGGPGRQASLLHKNLVPDFETRLVAGSLCPGESEMTYLLDSNEHVLRVREMSRELSFWSDARAFWKIFKFLRAERPQVVHTHTAKAGALGRLAAWMAGVPVIVHTYHGHVFYGYFSPTKTKLYLLIERLLGLVSTRIIAISESQQTELSTKYGVVPEEKICLIPNGFDLKRFGTLKREDVRKGLGLRADDFVLIWAARVVPVKDVSLLAEVIRKESEAQSKAYFLVVGDGEDKSKLEQLVQGCSNFRLLGWQDNMENIWSAGDAALLTSRNEGTPSALIEAMATGLPFVSTNVGGVKDLAVSPVRKLPDGMGLQAANGFLTARTTKALSYGITCLIEHPETAAAMGAAGRSLAMEQFDGKRLLADLKLLYRDLIKEKRGPECVASRVEETA